MPVNARARSFPVTIRETSSRPSGAASIPTPMRSRLTLGCANKALQQAEPIKRLVSGCRQVIAARNTYSRAKSAHLRTQKIAEPVVAALYQRPPARACGSWPPNRLARKTANLTAGRQDPVAGNKQRDRIFGHRLTNIARSLWPGAEFLRQSAIGRCVAPSDPPRRRVDLLEERVLLTKVEPEAGKIGLLALEIALHSRDCLDHLRRGRATFCAGQPAQESSFGRVRDFVGN